MSGLLLLGVISTWIAIVIAVAIWLGNRLRSRGLRFDVAFVITAVVLLPLPVADELISAPQFRRLCDEGTTLKFDSEKIRGRTIFYADDLQPDISVGLLRGYYIPLRLLDVTTKEELISYNTYYVKGGILIRTLGISEKDAPLTMRSYCGPSEHAEQQSFLNRYDLKYVDRKEVK
ncbi:MAG: hypothetical protein ABI583_07065 [Betaproteobacteria bacterium]